MVLELKLQVLYANLDWSKSFFIIIFYFIFNFIIQYWVV